MIARLAFASEYQNWNDTREIREQFNVTPTMSFGGGSIMVWGGIYVGASTKLVVIDGRAFTAGRYIRDVLQDYVISFALYINAGQCLPTRG